MPKLHNSTPPRHQRGPSPELRRTQPRYPCRQMRAPAALGSSGGRDPLLGVRIQGRLLASSMLSTQPILRTSYGTVSKTAPVTLWATTQSSFPQLSSTAKSTLDHSPMSLWFLVYLL